MKQLLRELKIDAVYGLDFETYWDKEYSLSKMATTEYITDPLFKAHMCSVQKDTWSKAKVFNPTQLRAWAQTIDWSRTGLLAHNTAFDGLIASRYFGIQPKVYLDTLSMARPVMPITVGGSLAKLCEAFGLPGKKGGEILVATQGKSELTKDEYKAMAAYAGIDIEQTWLLFHKLRAYLPLVEMRLIDLTLQMYCRPTLLIDQGVVEAVQADQIKGKATMVSDLKIKKEQLTSNEKFAELLIAWGVKVPMKISKRTGKPAYAMAKGDLEFKALLKHKSKRVRDLMEARFAVNTSILETRSERMGNRALLGAQPIFLNYWGAKTGRWSGGDKSNWQNLGRGSDLRTAIHAPPGHTLIIADLAQIEARINAWCSGQQDMIDAFAKGEDVYRLAASRVYGKPIDQVTPAERFVGKVMVLALGYSAGAPRFADMLRIGAFGPPIDISDIDAHTIHAAWRRANPFIVANWKRQNNNARTAFLGKQEVMDGVLTYEGFGDRGFTHGPGGVALRYDGLEADNEGMRYVSKYRKLKNGAVNKEYQRLYGGLIVENNTQFLARQVVAHQMVEIADALPNWRQVMTTHDEIVGVVPIRSAPKALRVVKQIMSTAPSWAPGLPLAVDAHISQRYDK